MNLRIKILLIFVLSELSLLAFFGYIAYDTARVTNTKNEIDMLASVTPRIADDIAHKLVVGKHWSPRLNSIIKDAHTDLIYLFVSNHRGKLISQPDQPAIQQVYQKLSHQNGIEPQNLVGKVKVNNIVYVWASIKIPNHNNYLTLIRQTHASHASIYFEEMGVPLIVAAVIMLWMASWAAMYVSMLIEKLDEQKNIMVHRSMHDVLTGLPNRALLNDRLQQLILINERQSIRFAICFIDLNRFKDVNDTLGHHVGDKLLLEVSKRLKENLRKSDTVARLGGDEFALIFRNVDKEKAKLIAEKILDAIEVPIEACGHKLFVSGSLGIAMFPEHSNDLQALLKKADVAMYAAKRAGSHLEFYDESQEIFTRDKLELSLDLHEAINDQQLELFYQPKFNTLNEIVVGAEALLRWNHPSIGFIPPSTFIPLAEYSGIIHAMTTWVLERAFLDTHELQRNGYDIPVSINLSAFNLQDSKFEATIVQLLESTGANADQIILELTESAMVMNPIQTKDLLIRLTKHGFRISVDDFGTGYSTLTNLRRLPISEIKIDRSFIGNITSDPEDATIVNAMIGLGNALELDVVAEGVETQAVLDTLNAYGCHTIQGYLIIKPMPLQDLLNWMKPKTLNEELRGKAV